jgi:ATP-dependent Clp protease adaptor protein ClpS
MTTTAEPKIVPKIKPKSDIPEPVRYNVIYINDEITTQEFVVETLVIIFNYTQIEAEEMTMKVHKDGSAVVATMPYEMAEQKGVEVTMLARNNGFPLVVKLEPEA